MNYGIRPIGALLGGALRTAIGLQTTLWISVLDALAGVIWFLFSPIPRLRAVAAGGLATASAAGQAPDAHDLIVADVPSNEEH